MDEELDRVVALVGERIDAKIGEITSDWIEALENEEGWRKDLEGKVAFLEEKINNCLTHQVDMVALVLSLQCQERLPRLRIFLCFSFRFAL